jgi:hypothetical protein
MPKAKAKSEEAEPIALAPLKKRIVDITVIGDSPLITHRVSDKAKKQILDRQMKRASAGREARNPEQEFQDSLYLLPDGSYGLPAAAFKNAATSACRQTTGLPMTKAGISFHVLGELVKIQGSKPVMREDHVKLESGVMDLRFRAMFPTWSATVRVMFNENSISLEQLINLFELAGMVGVGDWRPGSKKNYSGNFGMFHVARGNEGEQKKARR